MVEFGAKLSLKDNMYATLQKNLKMQKQFTEQVNKTSASVKSLGKQKANPVIKPKDQATKTLTKVKNTLKTVGKTVAKPFVAVKDGASKVLSKVKGTLKSIGSTTAKAVVAIKDVASAGLSKIKSTLSSLAKGITIGIGIAGAGVSLLAGKAIGEGANLEQSIGGVETLFKGDAGMVKANADMAFKTAGLSANSYMEQVTSFSASLLQSLGGDTQKSAQVADMAIIDMADNANKMGTSMDMIQNAYQGFAKQNYTMLDNLKLGYGGTQEEMQRLLDDASKLSGVEYDMGNLADVYNAIHVVQENLGITGTTAKEASETFSGSFATLKASLSNLFGNMAIGGDVTGAMEQVVDSAVTFLVNNAIPMLGNIFTALPKAIKTAIAKVAPQIKENGGAILQSIKDGIIGMLPASMGGIANSLFGAFGRVFNSVSSVVSDVAPKIMDSLSGAFGNGGGFLDGIVSAIEMAMPVIGEIAVCVADVVAQVAPILSQLGGLFMSVFPTIVQIVQTVVGVVQTVFPIIASVISTAITAVMPIIQAITSAIQMALPIVTNVINTIAGIVQTVLPVISQIFTEIGGKIAQVITTVVTPVLDTFKGVFEKLAPVISSAVGVISKVLSGAWKIISPILDLAMTLFKVLWSILEPIINALVDAFTWLWEKLEPVFSWLGDALGKVGDFIGSIGDWIGGLFDGGDKPKGYAYGKDRVPYDNYPARLHAGEKVLTRNQADQYDRIMSRGVSLTQPVASAPTSGGTSGGAGTINIEKLADTVVIHEEADVDNVVERMVTRFKQLVPNMA